MLKSLVLLSSSLGMLSVPSVQSRSNIVRENGMEITYKYESNEVNSDDDLIMGNVYNFIYERERQIGDFTISGYLVNTNYFWFDVGAIQDLDFDERFFQTDLLTDIKPQVSIQTLSGVYTIYFYFPTADSYASYFIDFDYDANANINLDIVLIEAYDLSRDYELLHFSTYNEIESVERYYPSNIFGNVSQFIDDNILNGIPNIDNVSYSIGGQNITLRSWLNTTICVVLACCLVGLLIWFVRYLFRLFSGLLH